MELFLWSSEYDMNYKYHFIMKQWLFPSVGFARKLAKGVLWIFEKVVRAECFIVVISVIFC